MFDIFRALRLTPILIILGLIFLFFFFGSLYILFFNSQGGNGLAGAIGLIFSGVLFVIILFEQALARRSNLTSKQLAIRELIILPFLFYGLYYVFTTLCG